MVEMGLIRNLSATRDGMVRLKFRPTSFHCPQAFQLAFNIYQAVEAVEGVKGVDEKVVDCVYAEEINSFLESANP